MAFETGVMESVHIRQAIIRFMIAAFRFCWNENHNADNIKKTMNIPGGNKKGINRGETEKMTLAPFLRL